jgi:hypothetical protein
MWPSPAIGTADLTVRLEYGCQVINPGQLA